MDDGRPETLLTDGLTCNCPPLCHEEPEDHGVEIPHTLAAPSPPSRQNAQEHAITHMHVRSWCSFRVEGRSKAMPRKKGEHAAEPEVPSIAVDDCFMSERNAITIAHTTEHPDDHANILVARDARSRCYFATAVPSKGVDPDECATRTCSRFLEFFGYQEPVLNSDQEPALRKVINSIRSFRGADTQYMSEHSPAFVSKANGFIERAFQTVEGQMRTLKETLEDKLGQQLPTGFPVFSRGLMNMPGTCSTFLTSMKTDVYNINNPEVVTRIPLYWNSGNVSTACTWTLQTRARRQRALWTVFTRA